jgi:hypothetical protein
MFSMVVMLETLVTKTDVSIARVNLTVAMNSGDVSTVAFFCHLNYLFLAYMGWFICHENLLM